jgi:subtilase family serine protease
VGFSRFSQPGVVARLIVGAMVFGVLLLAGPAPASAHAMTPAAVTDAGFNPCPPCYGPTEIRTAYDVPSSLTGAGTTIVIVSAFRSPVVQGDLDTFSGHFGMPSATVNIVPMDGTPDFIPNALQLSWVGEQSADVEWAHAIAPGAGIVVVEAKSPADQDLLDAIKFAIDNKLGDVFSMSFGEAETCPSAAFLADQHATFALASSQGITLLAASGDRGAAQASCEGALVASVSTPASDPFVTAVGGTHLTLDATGGYGSETVWSDMAGASGGGFSSMYRRPGYQATAVSSNKARGLPDVAWSSAFVGGASMIVFHGKPMAIFGTSIATPAWAGVVALADQAAGMRLGGLNHTLYQLAHSHDAATLFHDITSGNNSSTAFAGFDAAAGWDPVTGLGTPDVANLVSAIAARTTDG